MASIRAQRHRSIFPATKAGALQITQFRTEGRFALFPELLRGAYLELLAGASSRVRFTLRRTRLCFDARSENQGKLSQRKRRVRERAFVWE